MRGTAPSLPQMSCRSWDVRDRGGKLLLSYSVSCLLLVANLHAIQRLLPSAQQACIHAGDAVCSTTSHTRRQHQRQDLVVHKRRWMSGG